MKYKISGREVMGNRRAIDELEEILISELGSGCSYILEQNLRELGLTRESFKKSDVKELVSQLLKEYNKILGPHVNIIKSIIDKKFNN